VIKKILRMTVACDTCGDEFETEEPTAMAARIRSAVKGWTFAEGRLPGPGKDGQRQFDYCAKCWPTSPHAEMRR